MWTRAGREVVLLLGACTLIAGCKKGETNASDTMAADTTRRDTAAAMANATPQLSDANIAAVLDQANAADSAAGSIAASKGTNAQVKAFGRRMERDHHTLRKQGQDLVKKLNVTPQMPSGDTSATAAQHWQDSLKAMPKGAGFDRAYIDHEVAAHQQVVQTLQTAEGQAQNQELKDLITKATPVIKAHLQEAQQIQSKLGGSTAAGADTGKAATKKP
ncbi:MAG TPA: DUF4142 domain-containing protein [Gemmatimonadaceae bacterium]|nr:DUF4142 domain-containing protein [Gemmatimonadaceae bacterium]